MLHRLPKVAVVCPGQGILPRGCLYEFRSFQPLFAHTLQCIDDTLQENFSRHLMDRPLASIDAWGLATANAQPAIVASTYVISEVINKTHGVDLASHPRVSHFLGHSLGEYTALLLTGVLSLPEAISIVRKRGELMQKAVALRTYEMRSLLFKPPSYGAVYEAAVKRGVLACANNSSMVSVSGTPAELDSLVQDLNSPRKTVLKSTQLPVSIPFHNSLLGQIEPALLGCRTHVRSASKPLVSNLTGHESGGDVFANTVRCSSRPVEWKKSIEFLQSTGVDTLVNLGPGNAMGTINSRFDISNLNTTSPADLQQLAELLH